MKAQEGTYNDPLKIIEQDDNELEQELEEMRLAQYEELAEYGLMMQEIAKRDDILERARKP